MAPPAAIALCARVTLRYELPHLLPWIAYHHVLGVRHFILYVDRATSDNVPGSRLLLNLLKPHKDLVSIYYQEGSIMGQMAQVNHCVRRVGTWARWAADVDLDESFATNAADMAPDDASCPQVRVHAQDALATLVAKLDARNATAVLLPRLSFGPNGHTRPPSRLTQFNAFTKRPAVSALRAGKVLFRTDRSALRLGSLFSKHSVDARSDGGVLNPSGSSAATERCFAEGTSGASYCTYSLSGGGAAAAVYRNSTRFVRLHEYVTRSESECEQKYADNTLLSKERQSQHMSTWRLGHRAMCSASNGSLVTPLLVSDHSAACLHPLVSERIRQLFRGARCAQSPHGATQYCWAHL
jgi:hypothetical protein